jgi:hypothetical protein
METKQELAYRIHPDRLPFEKDPRANEMGHKAWADFCLKEAKEKGYTVFHADNIKDGMYGFIAHKNVQQDGETVELAYFHQWPMSAGSLREEDGDHCKCKDLEPGLLAIHQSCEHAALNGVGIKIPLWNFCPWCGKTLNKET